jgi:potassium efflux system protein
MPQLSPLRLNPSPPAVMLKPPLGILWTLITTLGMMAGAIHQCPAQNVSSRLTPFTEQHRDLYHDAEKIRSARATAEQFRRAAQSSFPVASTLATENAGLVDRWANLADAYNALVTRVRDVDLKLKGTSRDYDEVQTKIANYGLTPTVGLLLQQKKQQLDAWQVNDSSILFATKELDRTRQEQLELDIIRFNGRDPVNQAAELLREAGHDANQFQNVSLVSQLQSLLYQRSQWLDTLQQGYQDYQQKLSELDSAAIAFNKLTNEYRTLISRHIIWIRSDDVWSLNDIRNLKPGLESLFASDRTAAFGFALRRKWEADRIGGIGVLSLCILLLLLRWRFKTWLVEIGSRKWMRDAAVGTRKLAAGTLTVLAALSLPGVLFVIARWLGRDVVFESTLHTSGALYAASLVALLIEVPRQLLANYGYLDKYAGVELPRRQRASAYLTLIGLGLVLAAYIVTLANVIDYGSWRESVGRVGFVLSMLLVAWTGHLSLHPSRGFLEPLIAKFGGSVIHRLRFVLYLAALAFPLAMIALALLGYGFTANELTKRAMISLISAMVAATVWPGVVFLSSQAWQALTGAAPPRRYDEYGEIKTDSTAGVLAEHYLELKHQLAFLCQCALVVAAIACFGWLWIDAFPNVRMGNPVLWTVNDAVAVSPDANDRSFALASTEPTSITALHLLFAAITLFVAFQLAKLLPAVFDALVLQRVSFDEGMEHFFLVLGRCILFGVGCFIACKLIGIRWQSIQWLAVGLTIGLGFGLQDMVRNLFGGFVVLFEKPARLGDLITVGRITGRVAAQKFRTTVLSDHEGREVIIPNKNFVSEEVVNWMGAGRLRAIPIEVSVTRDQRSADICRSLQELVLEQSDVLLTPAPQATLVCVGKAFQRIEVLAWIEEGQDPNRFRDSLLRIATKHLRDKNLLSASQPPQPMISDASPKATRDPFASTDRNRKRSA